MPQLRSSLLLCRPGGFLRITALVLSEALFLWMFFAADSLEQLATSPPNAQGWLGPYAKVEDLKDAWNHPIEYRKPGANGAPFQLVSLGADKAAGGEGVDQDIVKP